MVEEKRERAEEASESPQKSPRLDPLAGPGCSDAPASPTESSDEWPSSGEVEAGISSDSTGDSMDDSGRCDHIRFDLDMVVHDLKVANQVLKEPRKCQHRNCKTTWEGASEDDQGMMKCIDCSYFFCSGWPVDRDDPQGHARWHAGEHQHWVAQWCDEPNLGYCFMCARPMRLSDWSEDDYAVAARNEKDQQMPGDSVAKDGWGSVSGIAKDERQRVPRIAMDDVASGYAIGDGHVIKGMPNHGQTCFMNATLQCLLALGKLRTKIRSPDAHLGSIGLHLQQLFKETRILNDARGMLDPCMILAAVRERYPNRFEAWKMEDSHEFLLSLFNAVNAEVEVENGRHVLEGGEVFPTFHVSLFGGQLFETTSCQRCPPKDPKTVDFGELYLSLPEKDPPARSVASPPRNKSHGSQTDKSDGDNKIQTTAEGSTSPIPGSGLGDGAMEKTPKPLQVDSSEVKDVVHGHMQTQKNDVPQEINEVPIEILDFIPDLFDDTEGMEEATIDSRNPEDKETTYSVKVTTKEKEEAQSSDIVHDEAGHMNSLVSIEDCLELFARRVLERCENCSKVAEQIMASTNINTTVDRDQTELSDRKTCPSERSSDCNSLSVESPSRQPYRSDVHHQVILSENITTEEITSGASCGEKDSASCSTASEKAEIDQGVQEAGLPADKQTDLLSAQDSPDTSTQNQGCAKQAMLDDHIAQQMEENQSEQKDGNSCAIQTQLINKLPAVLIIPFKRYSNDLSKLRGHVSFKEILHLGPFMDPRSEDKDNCSYRLVGVIEHEGHQINGGHYIAYVRGAGHNHQSSGSSSWVRASDLDIKEVSLEKVLGREAYMLFYERMED
ncbi:ubiquitin carboxyl-terminal hydrolase 2-like [Triticum dicoccoides]|uniref:ubiquitin carboxyl-terminal hydrolase 2-like n=1 Tax=Triticum dicoccoides TaxID=85692 RepID=UPI001891CF7E|nr:ubiquitin carboxyl-terminal hydrolase 2-like [Triticum dicoccoides]